MQTTLPVLLTFIMGMFMIAMFFMPQFANAESLATRWTTIIWGFALALGVDSLLLNHFRKIRKGGTQAIHSAGLIIAFFVTLFWGFYSWWKIGNPFDARSSFLWMFQYVYLPLDSTMFALLAFFIASAAYRAFRARSFESTLLLIAASIVMMGRVPLGGVVFVAFFVAFMILVGVYFLYESSKYVGADRFIRMIVGLAFLGTILPLFYPEYTKAFANFIPGLADWIMQVPNAAGQRGIGLGLSLGGIAFSLRILFGIERGYLR